MKIKFTKIKNYLLNLIYPKNIKCIFCNDELNQNEINNTCESCFPSLPFVKNPCEKCGCEMNENQVGVCLKCKRNNFNFEKAISVFVYENELVKVIHGIKYKGKKYLIKPLTKFMLEKFATSNIFVDIVTNIPMHPTKIKERGYNQSLEFAKIFAKEANINHIELCNKTTNTTSQTSLNILERLENVKDSFSLKDNMKRIIKDKSILIIDDVLTTGATTSELAAILLKAGASKCYVLSLASTKLNQITVEQDN